MCYSHVSGQQSFDLRSWPSCVVALVYGEAVLSPQCTNLCRPGCIEQHRLHYSVHPGSFVLRIDKFLLHCVGRFKVNRDIVFIEGAPEFLRCSSDIGNDPQLVLQWVVRVEQQVLIRV